MQTKPKPHILIICTGNCCRSHIAEGLLRHLSCDELEVHSAGTHPTGFVHPLAIETMLEHGIDITAQESKSLSRFDGEPFDYVITLCDDALQECPVSLGTKKQLHWSTEDPSFAPGTNEDRKKAFRKTIRLLEERIKMLLEEIGGKNKL
ncbi:MAG: arsenate reductase ArsC [Ignavibacteriales bacterium]|nr:arsenate reductase ArsC [Ignavibacteriales bacterium]